MPSIICVTPDATRTDPGIEGLEVSDSEWRLNVDLYREFIEATTGVSPTEDLSSSDCYRIGNRLQALVEEQKRQNESDQDVLTSYSDIESLKEIIWLARVFRACHACHEDGESALYLA